MVEKRRQKEGLVVAQERLLEIPETGSKLGLLWVGSDIRQVLDGIALGMTRTGLCQYNWFSGPLCLALATHGA